MSGCPNYIHGKRSINGVNADGLTDAYGNKEHMGVKAEACARTHGISREEQDDYAIESYRRALAATKEGLFRAEIAPIKVAAPGQKPMLVREDESLSKVSTDSGARQPLSDAKLILTYLLNGSLTKTSCEACRPSLQQRLPGGQSLQRTRQRLQTGLLRSYWCPRRSSGPWGSRHWQSCLGSQTPTPIQEVSQQ